MERRKKGGGEEEKAEAPLTGLFRVRLRLHVDVGQGKGEEGEKPNEQWAVATRFSTEGHPAATKRNQ